MPLLLYVHVFSIFPFVFSVLFPLYYLFSPSHFLFFSPFSDHPHLISLNTVPSLLSHDNSDIANDVVSLLQDMTDKDAVGEETDNDVSLVDNLVENNVLELLVKNLQRLNEGDSDEANAVHATLATVKNLLEIKPVVAKMIREKTRVLKWLIGKVKVREFDLKKMYASEILLQNSAAN